MLVHNIARTASTDGYTLAATIESEGRPAFRMEYVVHGVKAPVSPVAGNAFLAATLLPAVARREPLVIEAPVSARLLANTAVLTAIFRAWGVFAAPISATAQSTCEDHAPYNDSVGAFFSAGVDSFYTLLKPRPLRQHISHLLLVHGFDCDEQNQPIFDELARRSRHVADETDRRLIIVRTNLRAFCDPVVDWSMYHGAALASVGLAVEESLRTIFIASTHAYQELVPWGSHPLLDSLWSTEVTEFIHDGAEALRSEKISSISRAPLALENLRVCPRRKSTTYNCGWCEKCLRTMIGLYAARSLDQAATFPRVIDPGAVRGIRIDSPESGIRFLEDLISALGPRAQDRRLKAALRHVVRRTIWRTRLDRLVRWCLGPRTGNAVLETAERIRGGIARRMPRFSARSKPLAGP